MRLIDADKLKQHYAWLNNDEKELFDEIIDVQPTIPFYDAWDVFEAITSAEYGKQSYFLEPNGIVYSRRSRSYMMFEDALIEFINAIADDGSI